MKLHSDQNGSHIIAIVIIVVVLGIAGFTGYTVLNKNKNVSKDKDSKQSAQKPAADDGKPDTDTTKTIVMNNVGFKLDTYDEKTNTAGDMKFTKIPLMFDQIWGDFGQQDPRSPNDPTKKNPQPTYILPLGTKVLALVDGKVTKAEQIYSGDYTIMVQPEGSDLNFEHEHVSAPLVKVGDIVKSGQVIATVSEHDSQNHPGFGILEIGVLGGLNNRPAHFCPYKYLSDTVSDKVFAQITSVHEGWNTYLGKTVYGTTYAYPGCVTDDPFIE